MSAADLSVVRYHDGFRWCTAVMKRANKYLHLVHIEDAGVVVTKEPLEQERYLQPALRRGKPYELARAVKKFLAFGRERGITQAAKSILIEAQGGAA